MGVVPDAAVVPVPDAAAIHDATEAADAMAEVRVAVAAVRVADQVPDLVPVAVPVVDATPTELGSMPVGATFRMVKRASLAVRPKALPPTVRWTAVVTVRAVAPAAGGIGAVRAVLATSNNRVARDRLRSKRGRPSHA